MEHDYITIGIDPGNDSTKVVFRVSAGEEDCRPAIFDFALPLSDFPKCTFPSRVSIDNGKLYFGDQALERSGTADGFFSSMQTCLGCFNRTAECRNCLETGINHFRRGIFIYDERDVSAFDLMVFYLAFVIKQVRTELSEMAGLNKIPDFRFNIAFPSNYLAGRKRLFEYGVSCARMLSAFVYQGISLSVAYQYFEYLAQKLTIPDSEHPAAVVPLSGSRAAAYSLIQDESTPAGLYCIVDLGAGSILLSLLRFSRQEGLNTRIDYWAEYAMDVGSADFVRLIAGHLRDTGSCADSQFPGLIHAIRHSGRTRSANGGLHLAAYGADLSPELLLSICQKAISTCRHGLDKFLSKETHPRGIGIQRNKYVNLLYSGGGARLGILTEMLNAAMPKNGNSHWVPREFKPAPLALCDPHCPDGNGQDFQHDLEIFRVAHGLSFPVAAMPEFPLPVDAPLSKVAAAHYI